jgi:hypothetical protein
MNDDPSDNAYKVAAMIYDNALNDYGEFNPHTILQMFSVVDATRGFDEEFMCDLYDHLRTFAQDNSKFHDALIDSDVMTYTDIWGVGSIEETESAIADLIHDIKRKNC